MSNLGTWRTLSPEEAERRAHMVAMGLEHYGACACGVGSGSIEARLYKCAHCQTKVCYSCRRNHVCETKEARA